ncbi:hypothetical protein P692DRAFT_20870064 [Suillus brevipes Sb2]|nr:hypothetical protein P692DRAFT_20870064 [Suillus brevipes Sb2]
MKKKGLDSVFRVLEPVVEKMNERSKAPASFTSCFDIRPARSEWFRLVPTFFLPHSGLSSWFRTAGTAYIGNNLNVSIPAPSITRLVNTNSPVKGAHDSFLNCGQDVRFASLNGALRIRGPSAPLHGPSFDPSAPLHGSSFDPSAPLHGPSFEWEKLSYLFCAEVSGMKDKQALFVARRPESDKAHHRRQQHKPSHGQSGRMSQNPSSAATQTSAMPPAPGKQSRPISFWAHIILFLCCASPSRANANVN